MKSGKGEVRKSSKSARSANAKGKRGEREIIDLLQPVVTAMYAAAKIKPDEHPRLQRNKQQSDGGGFDIIGLPGLAIEIKNQQTVLLDAWWAQTLRQCPRDGTPLLLYKKGGRWHCRMFVVITHGRDWGHVVGDVSWGAFMQWFEMYLRGQICLYLNAL